MAASSGLQLSLPEKLFLVARLLTIIPLKFVIYAVRNTVLAVRNRLSVPLYLVGAYVRTVFTCLSAREVQYLYPTTRGSYENWMRQKAARSKDRSRLMLDVQPLDLVDSAILWMGKRSQASKIVLFLHGGGFQLPLMVGHLEWCWNCHVQAGADAGIEVAVAIVEYTRAAEASFPVQLRQAAAALGALLDAGVRPADIVVAGDSAGGNLTLQLLGHLLHPHPDVRRIELAEPLAGVVTVSPWLSGNTDDGSYREHGTHDMVSAGIIDKLGREYFGSEAELDKARAGAHPWVVPLDADDKWLAGVDRLTSKWFIQYGEREVLAADARGLIRILGESTACDIQTSEGVGEAHDFVVMESTLGIRGNATGQMTDWFRSAILGVS